MKKLFEARFETLRRMCSKTSDVFTAHGYTVIFDRISLFEKIWIYKQKNGMPQSLPHSKMNLYSWVLCVCKENYLCFLCKDWCRTMNDYNQNWNVYVSVVGVICGNITWGRYIQGHWFCSRYWHLSGKSTKNAHYLAVFVLKSHSSTCRVPSESCSAQVSSVV